VKHKTPDRAPPPAPLPPTNVARSTTRRAFLRKIGKRAVYVAPFVAALTASQVQAAPSPSWIPSGAYCEQDSNCCSDRCSGASMICAMA
jgi:hypothetical protein